MALDRLTSLLEQFPVRASLYHQGPLCGSTLYEDREGRGFLHVLRRGSMTATHPAGAGVATRLVVSRPSLLFYPHALRHEFHDAPGDPADFACATVHFSGGEVHPLARALPPLVHVPLDEVPSLAPALALLFDETARVRCGSRLVADRLFDVVLLQLLRWILDRDLVSVGLVAGLGDPRLARALTAIHESPGADWTLAKLAQVAGMSRSAFAARFREVVGETPADYIADWRLIRVCRLLAQGRTLSLAADEVGYSSHAALSRVFRRRKGMSPREWLRVRAGSPAPA